MVKKNKHMGSSFDEFLDEEGLLAASEIEAIKRIIAYLLQQKLDEHLFTKIAMADKLGTSRSGLDRILDPENTSITLNTLARAAELTGKKIYIFIKDNPKH